MIVPKYYTRELLEEIMADWTEARTPEAKFSAEIRLAGVICGILRENTEEP